MSKLLLNKKKYNNRYILKVVFYLFILLSLFLFFFKFYNHNYNQYSKKLINDYSLKYSFIFTELEITGINIFTSKDIEKYFKSYYNQSIFLIPLKKISEEIANLKWIKSITIKSNYQNKITILIEESNPVGVFFDGFEYFLINSKGEIIESINKDKILKYIIFSGEGNRKNLSKFIKNIPNSFQSMIKSAKFIGKRRWNIVLRNNILVKLPEFDLNIALDFFNQLYNSMSDQEKLEVEIIDLRIFKKAIIKFKE